MGIKIAKPPPASLKDEFDVAALRVRDTFNVGSRPGNCLIIAASGFQTLRSPTSASVDWWSCRT